MNDYERSIQALKEYDCKLSVKEWNRIAKEHGFLSVKSMTRISGMNFSRLNDEIRKI